MSVARVGVLLAHQLARARPGTPELQRLERLYPILKPVEQLACRAELHAMRTAKRGGALAAIGGET